MDVYCSKCGWQMVVESWFEEKEYRNGYSTGRVRNAASNLICPNCLNTEIIDDTFDGPWYQI